MILLLIAIHAFELKLYFVCIETVNLVCVCGPKGHFTYEPRAETMKL